MPSRSDGFQAETAMAGHEAVFLDRDGVINRDSGYVGRIDQFELLPGAVAGLSILQRAGFTLVVITNQSGIGRGLYTADDYEVLNRHFLETLEAAGIRIAGVLHCPHLPADDCACRKPRPGLLLEAAQRWALDLAASYMVGDRDSDVQAGRAAGVRACVLIAAAPETLAADFQAATLARAAEWIVKDRDTRLLRRPPF